MGSGSSIFSAAIIEPFHQADPHLVSAAASEACKRDWGGEDRSAASYSAPPAASPVGQTLQQQISRGLWGAARDSSSFLLLPVGADEALSSTPPSSMLMTPRCSSSLSVTVRAWITRNQTIYMHHGWSTSPGHHHRNEQIYRQWIHNSCCCFWLENEGNVWTLWFKRSTSLMISNWRGIYDLLHFI